MASSSKEASRSEIPPTEGIKNLTLYQDETILHSESDAEETGAVNKGPTNPDPDGQGGPSSHSGELKISTDLIDTGMKAFHDRNFAEASDCFQRALAIRKCYRRNKKNLTLYQDETILHSESDAEETGAVNKGPTNPDPDGQGGPSSHSRELKISTDLIDTGMKAFHDRNFAEASDCFQRALAIRTNCYGKFSPQCTHAYVCYGLALLNEVENPIGDDPIAVVPMEADKDGSINTANQDGNQIHSDRDPDGGVKQEGSSKKLKSAWNQLMIAWAILQKQPGLLQTKADVLDSLGDVAFQIGELDCQSCYLVAALENMVEPEFQHTPNIFSKIFLFLKRYSKTEAIAYCEKAVSVCETRQKRLINELEHSLALATPILSHKSSILPPPLYDSILRKKAEIDTLMGHTSNFAKKLEDMRESLVSTPTSISPGDPAMTSTEANPTPWSSGNLEMTSTVATTSSVKCSTQIGATNHCRVSDIDSPTASAALVDMKGGVMGGSGARRRSSMDPASAGSTLMKKTSSDSPIEKGDGSAS